MIAVILFKIKRRISFWFKRLSKSLYLFECKSLYKNRFFVSKDIEYGKDFKLIFDISNSKISIKSNTLFRDYCQLRSGNDGKISIGENVFFNNFCSLHCHCEIEIGNDNQFGEAVRIFDSNHNYKDTSRLISEQGWNSVKITIGNNCWIGANVTILKGVAIGDNVIIGANCLIYKSIPANALVIQNSTNTISIYQ